MSDVSSEEKPVQNQEGKGWVEVDVGGWLDLDEAEMKVVDFRVALGSVDMHLGEMGEMG